MITRRFLLAIGPSAFFGVPASAFAPANSWNNKKPEAWSEKEIGLILNRSPWAKEVRVEMDFSDRNRMEGGPIGAGPPGGGGPGGIGGPGGGPPGGGVGGPGGGPPGGGFGGDPGSMPPMKILVRWNSALPVRQASKGPSEGVAEYYLIFVSGLPMMGGGRRGSAEPPDPSTAVERLKSATSLQRKGKDPIFPERVEMVHAPAEGILFAFPRTSGVIALPDKEVTFATDMGTVKIKAKFPLKEMVYQGRLEL